jgi:hypothetical protein
MKKLISFGLIMLCFGATSKNDSNDENMAGPKQPCQVKEEIIGDTRIFSKKPPGQENIQHMNTFKPANFLVAILNEE